MNTPLRLLACIAATALLSACAGAPPARHVTLDDGRPRTAKSSPVPSVAVVRAEVPERIDRPQLVLRTAGNLVTLSERYRWAEPLRREIPRVIANDLGELLDSSQVAALPAGGFDADFKLTLDFQQFEAVVGQGVDVDVLWRLEHRSGMNYAGRSSFRQPLDEGASADHLVLVATQRQALRRVAEGIAGAIATYSDYDNLLHAASMP
jgi:uncharacterized lipoprotein YmbA